MRSFVCTLTLMACLACVSECQAEINAQVALTQIGTVMVGSWTPADQAKDGPRRHVYDWALDKKFVRTNGERDPKPWHGYMGVDLATDKVGWWGFFADGTSGVLYLTKFTKDEWVFKGDDFGPNGKFRRTVTISDPSGGRLHSKIEDTTASTTAVVEEVWVRHR